MLLDIIDTATAESAAEGYSRIALGVEYKGARYRGWQRQASGVPSVQQALEQALSKVANEPISVVCAGRTDAGVHGCGAADDLTHEVEPLGITIDDAAGEALDKGATEVSAYISHGVLSGPAVQRVSDGPLKELVITDSIEAPDEVLNCSKIRRVSVAPLIGEAIRRIANEESVSKLFD